MPPVSGNLYKTVARHFIKCVIGPWDIRSNVKATAIYSLQIAVLCVMAISGFFISFIQKNAQ